MPPIVNGTQAICEGAHHTLLVFNLRGPRLIYVSSDVATLARDAKFLARAGYQPVTIQPLDARPQTYHVETVSLWRFTLREP